MSRVRSQPASSLLLGRLRLLVALCLLAPTFLAACAVTPGPSPWHTLYTRPGWSGGASLDLRAVGDVMLARHVAEAAERLGADALLAEARPLLAGDLAVGNLESPLSERRDALREGPYRLLAPPALAPILPAAGFDALGLANNHALDGGPAALADTAAALRAAGVVPLGAGPGEAEVLTPLVLEAAGLRVALLALNDVLDPADGPAALASADDLTWASPDAGACAAGAGCAYGRAWLSARALEAVAAARADADVVVVLLHWGAEYAAQPSARQRDWAARLVAAGADLVLGAHPHVLQPAEPIASGGRTGFVAYSLGNFLFDAPPDPALSSGAVLRVLLDHDGVAQVSAAPLATAGARPRPLDLADTAARQALASLGARLPAPPEPTPAIVTPRPSILASPGPAALSAWSWDGATGLPLAAPAGLSRPTPTTRLAADLRGDGEPLWVDLSPEGVVTVRDGEAPTAPVVWTNERPAWRFTRIAVGDPNDDGRVELLMLLWQPDAAGQMRTQPYLLGWRGGRFRIIWGGSATSLPIQDLAIADLEGDGRSELLVLEGGAAPGEPGEHVSVWRWHGWGFQLEWRSERGSWSALALADVNGDGRRDLLAWP